MENGSITGPNQTQKLGRLACLIYFASYVTRLNYAAVISQIVIDTGMPKSAAALTTTAAFVSYGLGQLASGYMGDRLKPGMLIFLGLFSSSILNIAMALCSGAGAMAAVWFFNGLAQAMIWPPLLRLLTARMAPEDARKTTARVSISGSAGSASIYLLAPALIALSGWRLVFVFSAAIGILVSFVWLLCTAREAAPLRPAGRHAAFSGPRTDLKGLAWSSGLAFICLGIVLQGILRDGVSTWMPTFVIETLSLDSSTSIFSGALLPLFAILSVQAVSLLHRKVIRNELSCAVVMFAAGLLCASALAVFFPLGALPSALLMALLTGSMHGVNLMLVCMVPARFEKTGRVATISGVVNACTYVGSALSAYGIAKISELLSWRASAGSWALVAALGIAACLLAFGKWKGFLAGREKAGCPIPRPPAQ